MCLIKTWWYRLTTTECQVPRVKSLKCNHQSIHLAKPTSLEKMVKTPLPKLYCNLSLLSTTSNTKLSSLSPYIGAWYHHQRQEVPRGSRWDQDDALRGESAKAELKRGPGHLHWELRWELVLVLVLVRVTCIVKHHPVVIFDHFNREYHWVQNCKIVTEQKRGRRRRWELPVKPIWNIDDDENPEEIDVYHQCDDDYDNDPAQGHFFYKCCQLFPKPQHGVGEEGSARSTSPYDPAAFIC